MPAVVRPVDDERDGLLTFLAQQRAAVRVAAHGLTDDEAAEAASASSLTMVGLVQHLASVERMWAAAIEQRPTAVVPESASLAEAVSSYVSACAETDAAVEAIGDLSQAVPVPAGSRWAPTDVTGWSVRWVLLHLIQETARHAGHADIVRESIDGALHLQLMAVVEDWPPRRTITRWERRS